MNTSKRITLAKIAGAHGVKGLIKIFPFGEDISLLERCAVFTKDGTPIKIKLKNPSGKFILAEADYITTREEAIAAKGTELQINRDDLPEIDEDNSYYYEDLIGLKAIAEDGAAIGTVIAVDNYGAGDLLEIRRTSGEKFLLPFTDEFAPRVDLENNRIIVIPMEEI